MKFTQLTLALLSCMVAGCAAFSVHAPSKLIRSSRTLKMQSTVVTESLKTLTMAGDDNDKSDKKPTKKNVKDLEGFERFKAAMEEYEENQKDPKKKKGPPIYNPGPYQMQLLASLAYLVPIVDAVDLSKYMFEAYPDIAAAYNAVFGPIAAIYNGVPFLPFAVFFLMSYICRAPNFSPEVRFHFSQAFMVALIQFVPSLTFGFLEKAGVPFMGVAYNTVFLWVMFSSLSMQFTLLNPLSVSKNPLIVNVVGWAMRYMNWTPDMAKKQ